MESLLVREQDVQCLLLSQKSAMTNATHNEKTAQPE